MSYKTESTSLANFCGGRFFYALLTGLISWPETYPINYEKYEKL